MKNIITIVTLFLLPLSLFMANDSFAVAEHLKTEEAKAEDVEGTFTVILYGARDYNDLETIAILDYEADQYTLEPYAPKFDYKIKKGLSAREALAEAYKFTSYHPSFWHSQLSRIIDQKGATLGMK